MANSEAQNGFKDRVEKETLWIIGITYCFMLSISLYVLIKTIVIPNCPAIFRQRFFHSILILNSLCIGYLGRIIWVVLFAILNLESSTVELFDSLPNIIMCFLATTISFLWYEIYLSSNILLTPTEKTVRFILCFTLYLTINSLSIVFHLLIIYDKNGNWNLLNNKFKNTALLDSCTNIINTICITVTGCLLASNAKLVFISRVGNNIALRINRINLFTFIMFVGKTIVLVISIAYVSLFTDKHYYLDIVMILVYFVGLEIAPMGLIIYILQKTSQKVSEDELPSVFNSFISRNERLSDLACSIANKLFIRDTFSIDSDRSRSKSNGFAVNIQTEVDKRFKKRGSSRV